MWFRKVQGVETYGYSTDFIKCFIDNLNRNRWHKMPDGSIAVPGLSWVYAKKTPAGPYNEEYVGVYFSNENRLLGYIEKGSPPPEYPLTHPEMCSKEAVEEAEKKNEEVNDDYDD